MNYLQRYIEVLGISCQDIATATGYGYHSIQKTVKGHRRSVPIRAAITQHLGLDNEKTWGRGSVVYLRRMVAVAANRMADEKADAARSKFLAKYGEDAGNVTAKRRAVNV